MTDDDDEFTPPPPRRRFARLRGCLTLTAFAVAVLALVVFGGRRQLGRMGQRQLDATTQRIDADDPGWRLDEMLAARAPQPPPERDAAALVLELADDMPGDWMKRSVAADEAGWHSAALDNRRPSDPAVTAAADLAGPTRTLRVRALALADKKAGRYPLVIADDPIATTLPHLEKARVVASLLKFDGGWETLHGNPNRGVAAARAGLGVARSVGDEPTLISQLVRMATAKVAADTAMQTLAWGEPTEGLAELQAELLAEADVPWFRIGMRGERAMLDRLFEGLESGVIPPENAARYFDRNASPTDLAAFRLYKALLPGDRAQCLWLCTQYAEIARLPPHQQLARLRAIPLPQGPPDEFRYLLTRLLLPACERVAETSLRVRAELLAAAACVACERYRRKHGRFPDDLEALAPEFLPAVPLSPFDGQPLRCRPFPDRVAVYAAWPDAPRHQPDPPDDLRDGTPGKAVGYRLWWPAARGLPPKPPAKADP